MLLYSCIKYMECSKEKQIPCDLIRSPQDAGTQRLAVVPPGPVFASAQERPQHRVFAGKSHVRPLGCALSRTSSSLPTQCIVSPFLVLRHIYLQKTANVIQKSPLFTCYFRLDSTCKNRIGGAMNNQVAVWGGSLTCKPTHSPFYEETVITTINHCFSLCTEHCATAQGGTKNQNKLIIVCPLRNRECDTVSRVLRHLAEVRCASMQ